MRRFTTLTGIAAALPDADIDTDVIFPARFLLLTDKAGLGKQLFFDRRFDKDGAPREEFVLNRRPFDRAQILIAGNNFGTGSSREHAVWALVDFGVRCVIAPSFGEIFYLNCFKNGLLPIRVTPAEHAVLLDHARSGRVLTVDLERLEIRFDSCSLAFSLDATLRRGLLEGLDEIDQILADDLADIVAFEARQRQDAPWLVLDPAATARAIRR
jgi:3-isopropylmalate/(R)-2-methylmalate dehydratase small subunit